MLYLWCCYGEMQKVRLRLSSINSYPPYTHMHTHTRCHSWLSDSHTLLRHYMQHELFVQLEQEILLSLQPGSQTPYFHRNLSGARRIDGGSVLQTDVRFFSPDLLSWVETLGLMQSRFKSLYVFISWLQFPQVL